MDWVLQSPQIHSTFGNLRFVQGDGYHVYENCNAALKTILHNILTEDKYLRTYRRNISFGQNIQKDLIPLLIHTKEDKTFELLTQILVNLTIPIECLLSVDIISKTDFGRHTVFEINNLLATTKVAFTEYRATRVIIEFLKKNMNVDQKVKLTLEQCANICNSLLLLRNILHIPEEKGGQSPNYYGPNHALQNQIIWNMFSQGIDKVLIKLMIIPDATNWSVTMVQLIALLYKDQHVETLLKLLNLWIEASLSESSEDNESNTSPLDRASANSSPLLTSDPTSDSSDTGGSGISIDEPYRNSDNGCWNGSPVTKTTKMTYDFLKSPKQKGAEVLDKNNCPEAYNNNPNAKGNRENRVSDIAEQSKQAEKSHSDCSNNERKTVKFRNSDCGYGTQMENQESISTSSNEDELPTKKPIHQKPHNLKQKVNTKGRVGLTLKKRERKKIVKRGKTNRINVQGLFRKTPTDDDVSNILKDFTIDFLLKGYNCLVQTLHTQILTNLQLEIDTSHFFWLITYFPKFATQIELDLKHICSVLSFDIVSYLTAEGVNLCEQFELATKLDGNDLKPSIRRLHLVVTAIREFVQAIEAYKKFSDISKEDQDVLANLQFKMCETEELRSLFVLLLRQYNPKYHSKQYLQDLVVTNHILITFIDNVIKLPEYKGATSMDEHIKQFATTEVMNQYGLLLEDYSGNGEFVNDCIFTLMHHVGGDLSSLITLFQPKILKTFTSIWNSEFEICDDWSDLIEYVINTFVKKPHTLQSAANFRLDTESFDDEAGFVAPANNALKYENIEADNKQTPNDEISDASKDRWTEDELSSLTWNYMKCSASPEAIAELVKMFKEDGIIKTRDSVIKELKQNLINKEEFDKLTKGESERNTKNIQINKEMRDEEIANLCEQLTQDGKLKFLGWVQKELLETCFAKVVIDKAAKQCQKESTTRKDLILRTIQEKIHDLPIMSPVSYHSLLLNQSVPLVPWNCEQASICRDLKFLQLLHKLGFHIPVDSGKVFIRIPHFWTVEFIYEVAGKILHIDQSKLKFSINDVEDTSSADSLQQNDFIFAKDPTKDATLTEVPDNGCPIHEQKQSETVVNSTPTHDSPFNSDSGYETKRNWFELVQKSKEYKLSINPKESGASNEDVDGHSDELMVPADRPVASLPLVASWLPVAAVEKETNETAYNTLLPDSESYYTSVCETASVASDLTRMYVSDEDEKPDVVDCPAEEEAPVVDESSELEATPKKRPRVQTSPPKN